MAEAQKPISDMLLDILVCPVCKKKVVLKEDQSALVCQEANPETKCPRTYQIVNGIPKMLVED